jgi:anti-anti-sigma regulatory factor
LVEGTLSGDWVEVLEKSWLEAQRPRNGDPMRIDLSGVTWIDDKGRELLARMIRDGAELRATEVMTRAVIEEIRGDLCSNTKQVRLRKSRRRLGSLRRKAIRIRL